MTPQFRRADTAVAYCLLFLFILLTTFVAPTQSLQAKEFGPRIELMKVEKIEITGNHRIEAEAILEKLRTKVGTKLDNFLLQQDLRALYSMNYFDQVEFLQDKKDGKNVLIIKVKERPIIQKIIYQGNSGLSADDLKEKIKTKEFNILDVNSLKNDANALLKLYEEKGYYLASVSYELRNQTDETVEVVFKIREFEKIKVKKITFLGNRVFSDSDLKGLMETNEEGLFSGISGSGSFKEFNFETDVERLKYFYKTKGYLQVNIGRPEVTVSEDRRWVFISVKINEGPQYTINRIVFEGDQLKTEEEFKEKIKLKEGETYSEDLLRQDIQALTEVYQDEGYAFANVLRNLEIVPGENKVDVHFMFEKGKLAYFGKITVKGNSKTRDKVVLRELKIEEGKKFSGTLLRESKENVNRLGFFEPNSVVFNTVSVKGRDDILDIEISVKEANTGQISLGAGYSTATKGFIQASIAQKNFRGLGQDLSFSLNLASTSKDYRLGLIEPYLLDTKWTAGGDIYRTLSESSNAYKSLREGFDTRIGHPIFEYTRLFFVYKFENTLIEQVNDPTIDVNLENGISSSVEVSMITDKRDNRLEPTKGFYSGLSVEYAGVGGVQKWLKSELDGRYYLNVVGDLVMRTRMVASKLMKTTEKDIARSQKYVLGGSRNLRGYGSEDVGPLTEMMIDGKKVVFNQGGLFSFYTTIEFEHPLVREAGLKWVVFFDAGNIFNNYIGEKGNYTLRSDYGFGIRWFSPIGPLRFEFGYPLDKKIGTGGKQFIFDIGQLF